MLLTRDFWCALRLSMVALSLLPNYLNYLNYTNYLDRLFHGFGFDKGPSIGRLSGTLFNNSINIPISKFIALFFCHLLSSSCRCAYRRRCKIE